MKYQDASPVERGRARRARSKAAARYKPSSVELLLVAEAPPEELDRFFYFDDVASDDWLFIAVAKELLCLTTVERSQKSMLLAKLRGAGVYLIDLCEEPKSKQDALTDCVPGLVRRSSGLRPNKMILIKVNVYDLAFEVLRRAGLPVMDERIAFPSTGRQKDFQAGFRRALDAPRPPRSHRASPTA